MTLDIARFGKYTVRPVREAHYCCNGEGTCNSGLELEGCDRSEAEAFGVYKDDEKGLPRWVADFDTEADATEFAAIKGSEALEVLHQKLEDLRARMEGLLASAKERREELDALHEMLPHLCDDCRLGIPTTIRRKFTPPRMDEETMKDLNALLENPHDDIP